MTEKKKSSNHSKELRRMAEEQVRADSANIQETLSPEQTRRMLYELQVHQVELEMQNEVLRKSQNELETSRLRYFDLYDLAPVGYFTLSQQGLILEANLTAATMLGLERSALVMKPLTSFILPEDQDINYFHRNQLFETGSPQVFEVRMLKKDSASFWALVASTVKQNDDGASVCLVVISDITRNKVAEKALERARERLLAIFDTLPEFVYLQASDYSIRYANRAFKKLFSEPSGRPCYECIQGRQTPCESCPTFQVFQTKQPQKWEWARETDRVYMINDIPFEDVDGTLMVMEIGFDITEQKQGEESLRELKTAIEQLMDGIAFADKGGHIRFVNSAWARMHGYSVGELVGRHLSIFHTKEQLETDVLPFNEQALATGFNEGEIGHVRKDGTTFPTWMTSSVVRLADQKPGGWIGTARDITDQKQSKAELVRLGAAIEQAQETVLILNSEGIIQYANKAVEKLTGRTRQELIGSIIPADERYLDQFRQALEIVTAGKPWTGTITEQNKDGSSYDLELTITPVNDDKGGIVSIVSIGRDVTRERQLEHQLLQSQKMEAIGTLAGGIAHDFNNILGGMLGYTQIAQEELPKDNPAQYYLAETKKLGDRATDLVKQVLSFSRKNLLERKPVTIHLIVKEAIKLLQASIPAIIEIRPSVNEQAGMVMSDPTQIHQMIINLCTNAAHAMEGKSGVLGIDLSPVALSFEDVKAYPDVQPGDYVRLIISDTGTGIDPAIADRIFDPFFTTKDVGKGTGMGLSIVHGIVKSHDGTIIVESTPGKGSTFQVLLPRMSGEVKEEAESTKPLPLGTERILFVDDEEALTELAKMMLEPLGYKVTAVQSSLEALELFQKSPEKFDLVITDLSMPHMTGYDLVQQLIKFRPDIPVILCTGYNETVLENRENEQNIKAVLIKPVNRRKLAETIRKILDTR